MHADAQSCSRDHPALSRPRILAYTIEVRCELVADRVLEASSSVVWQGNSARQELVASADHGDEPLDALRGIELALLKACGLMSVRVASAAQ
jgi:hypothetical protein